MAENLNPRRRLLDPLAEFLHQESSGALVLLLATVVALVWANSPWQQSYIDFWQRDLTLGVGATSIELNLRHWVDDGLMVFFFFLVGLEIKRELVVGELRDRRTAALPGIAAVGGMLVPALCFLAINAGTDTGKGWGIPMATDIAFAVGMLALLGPRVPSSLKLFLLTLAIVDDIGAILVIAVFYSDHFEPDWFAGALLCLLVTVGLRIARVRHPLAYAVPAFMLWVTVFESGVHATIAGVVLGLLVPARPPAGMDGPSPIEQLERTLHPFVAFLVVPAFALANAGILISRDALSDALHSRLTWGIVVGLVLGKTVGISLATRLGSRLRMAQQAPDIGSRHVLGVGALGGIGFTVSLFVAELAFAGTPHLDSARIGILVASVLSALTGAAMLRSVKPS